MAAKKPRPRRAKPARRSTSDKKPARLKELMAARARRQAAAARKASKTAKKRAPASRKATRPKAPRKAKPTRSRASSPRAATRKPSVNAARPKAAGKKAAGKPAARSAAPARPRRVPTAPLAELRYPTPPSTLDRNRKQLSDDERLDSPSADLPDSRQIAMARSGHDELRAELEKYSGSGVGPKLTAGDVDADWQDAYSVGDEAPGGDNPTPDQDRVDDIGAALGVNYGPGEELQGSDKIAERDRHRWELDPASSDDWPHDPTRKSDES